MNEMLREKIAAQFKNTELGYLRIKRNLNLLHLSNEETESYLKIIILSTSLENIKTKGKNYYFTCTEKNAVLTINANTYTVITAKQFE